MPIPGVTEIYLDAFRKLVELEALKPNNLAKLADSNSKFFADRATGV